MWIQGITDLLTVVSGPQLLLGKSKLVIYGGGGFLVPPGQNQPSGVLFYG